MEIIIGFFLHIAGIQQTPPQYEKSVQAYLAKPPDPPVVVKPQPITKQPVKATGSFSGGVNAHLQRIKMCESGGNYANKKNPNYRGAYQFSYATWRGVGGSGDPADASPAEQDYRAQLLYNRSGPGQWPTCSKR